MTNGSKTRSSSSARECPRPRPKPGPRPAAAARCPASTLAAEQGVERQARGQREPAAPGHGLDRVADEVVEHLHEAVVVGPGWAAGSDRSGGRAGHSWARAAGSARRHTRSRSWWRFSGHRGEASAAGRDPAGHLDDAVDAVDLRQQTVGGTREAGLRRRARAPGAGRRRGWRRAGCGSRGRGPAPSGRAPRAVSPRRTSASSWRESATGRRSTATAPRSGRSRPWSGAVTHADRHRTAVGGRRSPPPARPGSRRGGAVSPRCRSRSRPRAAGHSLSSGRSSARVADRPVSASAAAFQRTHRRLVGRTPHRGRPAEPPEAECDLGAGDPRSRAHRVTRAPGGSRCGVQREVGPLAGRESRRAGGGDHGRVVRAERGAEARSSGSRARRTRPRAHARSAPLAATPPVSRTRRIPECAAPRAGLAHEHLHHRRLERRRTRRPPGARRRAARAGARRATPRS